MSTVKEEHAAATNILLRKQVGTLRERIKVLSTTNSKLKHQSRISEKDTNDFVEYFQNEINFLNEKNLELQAQIAMLVKESKDYRERSQKEHKEVTDMLKSDASKMEETLRGKIKSLTAQLEDVAQFQREKAGMLEQLETLRNDVVSGEDKKREEIAAQERKFLEEKQRLQADYDAKIVLMEKTAAKKAKHSLDRKVKLLFIENDQTVKELRAQKAHNKDLKEEVAQLEETNKVLQREQALFDQSQTLSATQGARRTRELESRAKKIAELESTLNAQVLRGDSQLYQLQRRYDRDVGDLKLEVQGLRQLIKLKSKEFRKMKRLAQTVLDQRSETEMFFNEALDRVKKEKAAVVRDAELAEREEFNRKIREANRKKGKRFPSIRKTVSSGDTSRPAHGPVTYHELSTNDKERILELLFARINNQQRELRNNASKTNEAGPVQSPNVRTEVDINAVEDEVDRLTRSAGQVPHVLNLSIAGESSQMRPEME